MSLCLFPHKAAGSLLAGTGLLVLLLDLPGCASGPAETGADAAGMGTTQDAGRGVTALVAKAAQHEQRAQWERAAALLERALRIEPRNARLWHRLATIRFQQGRYGMAESLAQKSKALTKNDEALDRRNAELIDAARRAAAPG